ncbi:MAG: hypothetical protein ACRDRE_18185 [Pseudonocardiaceae bacterium]
MAGEGLAAGSFHLISHHEVRWTGRITPRYYALCGARMDTGDGVGDVSGCPNACECEFSGSLAYCLDCLRAALEQNQRSGVDGSVAATRG